MSITNNNNKTIFKVHKQKNGTFVIPIPDTNMFIFIDGDDVEDGEITLEFREKKYHFSGKTSFL